MHARTCCACDQDTSTKDVRPQPHTNACVCTCMCSEELAKITGESGHWHINGRKRSLAYKRKKADIGTGEKWNGGNDRERGMGKITVESGMGKIKVESGNG